ncbi:hypothetical protein V1525DRAFT_401968 [Lipomyces kononenkoae]|uniref:Uncharacterized protein n=1 Tax=Lipomyces kononenkoae TaxID=34357 RepID=A0ACC3T3B9_LIPKO
MPESAWLPSGRIAHFLDSKGAVEMEDEVHLANRGEPSETRLCLSETTQSDIFGNGLQFGLFQYSRKGAPLGAQTSSPGVPVIIIRELCQFFWTVSKHLEVFALNYQRCIRYLALWPLFCT